MKYDVVFIGSGPAGYFGAIRAAQLGLKTACVEKHSRLGGTCLNVGCIPSKTLLATTEHYEWMMKEAQGQGIVCKELSLDYAAMMKRKEDVVISLTNGIAGLFKKNQVDSIKGTARFTSPTTIQVNSETIESANFVISTGSEPIELPFLKFNEKKVLSSTGALSLPAAPKKMLIIGAGAIGVELASVYSRQGTEITIVEMLDKITPTMDAQVSRTLQQILKKQGLNFILSAQVTKAEVKDNVSLEIKLNDQTQTLTADCVLVAVGRWPFTKELGLDKVGIQPDKRGFIAVDKQFRTSVPNIYAIGDVIEGPMLAHKAFREGMVAAEIIAGRKAQINYLSVPNVIYTNPEVAAVGLTEQEAKELGIETKIGMSHFRGNARARCIGVNEGFVKVIGDKATDRLVGVHIIGQSASEMIGEAALAMELNTTITKMAETPYAHPTLSEAIKEACLGALGRAIES